MTLLVFAAGVLLVPQVAEACPVCFGDIGGPAARGVNNGILTMLGVVFTVQIAFGVLFVGIMRRSKQHPEADASDGNESVDALKEGRR
jgi:hypothetical protein